MRWQEFNEECPDCGATAMVLTSSGKDNSAYDGDEAKCGSCCTKGWVVVCEEWEAYIEWDVGD